MEADVGLGGWVDGIASSLGHVEGLAGEEDFEPDFSGASLGNLERALLLHFGGPHDIDDPGRRGLAAGVAGYLGEVLLGLAGGAWGWRDGEPFVCADAAVGVAPVYPLRLLAQALSTKSGHQFCEVYGAWQEAVVRQRGVCPSWVPKKTRTPGVAAFAMDRTHAACIASWCAERQEAFARWIKTYGAGVEWDFGPASLDVLEGLLLGITPTPEALYERAHRDFVQGAVWYLGEAIRRIRGGQWVYGVLNPKAPSIYVGDPCVEQSGANGALVMPIVVLLAVVRDRVPGELRAEYARCSEATGSS